jgi:hypothetical protein
MIEYLAENSLPIWMGGAVAFTMALVVYLQTRSNAALFSMVAVVALVATLLVTEWLIETPREAVERTLYELANMVERNDVPGTLAYMTPDATVRKDVATLMPLVNIERARVMGTPQIEMVRNGAIVKCRGLIIATNKQNGMKGGAEDQVSFVVRDGRWRLKYYSSERNWHRALGR